MFARTSVSSTGSAEGGEGREGVPVDAGATHHESYSKERRARDPAGGGERGDGKERRIRGETRFSSCIILLHVVLYLYFDAREKELATARDKESRRNERERKTHTRTHAHTRMYTEGEG